MLIEELIGLKEASQVELQQAVEDMLLRARKNHISELDLDSLVSELSKEFPGIYVRPGDTEFKQEVSNLLHQSDWVSGVNPTGKVLLKKPGELNKLTGEPGAEIEKQKQAQKQKVQRDAMSKVKKDEL